MKLTYLVAALVPLSGIAACLFPSFDDLTAPARSGATGDDEDDDPSGGGSEPRDGGAKPKGDSGEDEPEPEQGADGAPPKRINCGSSSCDPTVGDYCCFAFGSPECNTPDDIEFCESSIKCDGNEDCPSPDQVCCLPKGDNTSSCRTSCNGKILCDPKNPRCPEGKSCLVEHVHNESFKSFSCQ